MWGRKRRERKRLEEEQRWRAQQPVAPVAPPPPLDPLWFVVPSELLRETSGRRNATRAIAADVLKVNDMQVVRASSAEEAGRLAERTCVERARKSNGGLPITFDDREWTAFRVDNGVLVNTTTTVTVESFAQAIQLNPMGAQGRDIRAAQRLAAAGLS
jgi:hypothetical protein